jgi:hypothetical protein
MAASTNLDSAGNGVVLGVHEMNRVQSVRPGPRESGGAAIRAARMEERRAQATGNPRRNWKRP